MSTDADPSGTETIAVLPGVTEDSGFLSQDVRVNDALDALFDAVGEDWETPASDPMASEGSSSYGSGSSGRIRPAGDADPGGPVVIELTDILRLTVQQYSLVPGGSPGSPFASASGATLEFLQYADLGPVTLGQVSLYGSATDITGFRTEGLHFQVEQGELGPDTSPYFSFTGLNFRIPLLEATRGAEGWGLDAGSTTLTVDSARLLPGRSDLLTGQLTGLAGTLDVADGRFSLNGEARLEVGGLALFSGQVSVQR